jgi:uncharacterized protein YjiS (DUF1127 family)
MAAIWFESAGRPIAEHRRRPASQRAGTAAARVVSRLGQWRRRAKSRADLAALDDRMLADIGVTRAEAEFLSNKPFWRK